MTAPVVLAGSELAGTAHCGRERIAKRLLHERMGFMGDLQPPEHVPTARATVTGTHPDAGFDTRGQQYGSLGSTNPRTGVLGVPNG